MVRTQIQLTERQAHKLKERSAREGISMAEAIRRALDQSMDASDRASSVSAWERAIAAAGCADSGLGDLAANHDAYLAEAYTR